MRRSLLRGFGGLGLSIALLASACALMPAAEPDEPPSGPRLAELVAPAHELARRDLFWGPGGRALAPPVERPFRFLSEDHSGGSPSMEVEDATGRVWDVKWGPEASVEVVASRLVWAAGFHQPPTYFVPEWTLVGRPSGEPAPAARFRPELPAWDNRGNWDWRDNPFVGTRELGGLVALMALLNNWDLKSEQNILYEIDGEVPQRRYTVRDLGAALGASGWLHHTKGDIAGFEQEPFLDGVEGEEVHFHFRGGWREPLLTRGVTVDEVLWLCRRLSTLSDAQLRAAFRAGGISEPVAARYVAHLRSRIGEGLRLAQQGDAR